jgi:hypothetical protein
MKKIIIILLVISLSGCVAERKGEPAVAKVEIPKCPEIIKAAAQNLEDIGVDKEKVQTWATMMLALKIQPCDLCQKVVNAVYVLKDEKGIYKSAMITLMQAVEKTEPIVPGPAMKQNKEIGDTLKNKNDVDGNTEAKKYLDAVEQLQVFLIDDLRIPKDDAKNFIIDHFFIPLMTKSD